MRDMKIGTSLFIVFLVGSAVLAQSGGSYSLDCSTIDGGGGRSSGGT
ncbi:MAG: hypothetical protein ACYTEL_07350 [Planctomycetota bacterium]|jgi:hypothetical protein